MSGPIQAMPIDKMRAAIGAALGEEQVRADPKMLLICLSMGEYLRDAERWHYVERYEIPQGMSPRETRKWVDDQLKEIEDGIERAIRTRQRREDGVPGGSGAGGTPDPIV